MFSWHIKHWPYREQSLEKTLFCSEILKQMFVKLYIEIYDKDNV